MAETQPVKRRSWGEADESSGGHVPPPGRAVVGDAEKLERPYLWGTQTTTLENSIAGSYWFSRRRPSGPAVSLLVSPEGPPTHAPRGLADGRSQQLYLWTRKCGPGPQGAGHRRGRRHGWYTHGHLFWASHQLHTQAQARPSPAPQALRGGPCGRSWPAVRSLTQGSLHGGAGLSRPPSCPALSCSAPLAGHCPSRAWVLTRRRPPDLPEACLFFLAVPPVPARPEPRRPLAQQPPARLAPRPSCTSSSCPSPGCPLAAPPKSGGALLHAHSPAASGGPTGDTSPACSPTGWFYRWQLRHLSLFLTRNTGHLRPGC